MTVKIYEVGGCVRDELLGIKSKDIDFAVEAESFAHMRQWMEFTGFKIFVETPKFFTIRAHFPRDTDWAQYKGLTADFVLCRKERDYVDGRRPETVEVGTIYDDLARRDFTVNAMAKDPETGNIIDPHGGKVDLYLGLLDCVGSARERFTEDSLRALRAIRFAITKDFKLSNDIDFALGTKWLPELLSSVSQERIQEEMLKAFKHDTCATIKMLERYPKLRDVIFGSKVWLKPTMEAQ